MECWGSTYSLYIALSLFKMVGAVASAVMSAAAALHGVSDTTCRRRRDGSSAEGRVAGGGTIRHFGFAAMRVVGCGGGGFSELINSVRSPRPNATRLRVYMQYARRN